MGQLTAYLSGEYNSQKLSDLFGEPVVELSMDHVFDDYHGKYQNNVVQYVSCRSFLKEKNVRHVGIVGNVHPIRFCLISKFGAEIQRCRRNRYII